jgi:hypothetical protein
MSPEADTDWARISESSNAPPPPHGTTCMEIARDFIVSLTTQTSSADCTHLSRPVQNIVLRLMAVGIQYVTSGFGVNPCVCFVQSWFYLRLLDLFETPSRTITLKPSCEILIPVRPPLISVAVQPRLSRRQQNVYAYRDP